MDITRMDDLGFCGRTVDRKTRAALQVLMLQKQLQEGLLSVRFWGRITGKTSDYFICYGVAKSSSGVPVKKFYVTFDLNSLSALPELTAAQHAVLERFDDQPFTGTPDAALDGGFTESHRLARTVGLIDNDTTLVPRGAYVVDASKQVLENSTFAGLDHMGAGRLASYFHFRPPTKLVRKSVLAQQKLVKSTDFLDAVDEDCPNGIWSLQLSANKQTATLRSLLWPGYFFYHHVNTSVYGGAYFGDGRKNSAILFMV